VSVSDRRARVSESGEERRTDIFVVPVVERALGDLEVLAVDAPRELLEEGDLDLLELGRLDDVEDLLDLVQVHDLLGRVDLWPVAEEAEQDLLGESRVLLEELDDAVGQLGVVEGERLGLVERDEDAGEERLVLLLERECKAVDDGAEDLEQLGDAVVALRLVDKLEENVVDRPPDEGPEIEELAVYPVERRLEEVALARVLAVKELEQLLQSSRSGAGQRLGERVDLQVAGRPAELTWMTNDWSMYFLAVLVLKSGLSTKRRKNS
jgi:hypothetical protein